MNKILFVPDPKLRQQAEIITKVTQKEIESFKEDGAIFLKNRFDIEWIKKLKLGIKKAKNNPSPRFVNHTKDKKLPGYYEDFWTWDLHVHCFYVVKHIVHQ